MHERRAIVTENGRGPLGQTVRVGAHEVYADEPPDLGGLGQGLDPFEFLLAGLGACTSMTVRLYAQRKGWPLERIEVSVRHAEQATSGAAQDVFEREISLFGELSDEERQRLMQIADRCPVSRTLAKAVIVRSTLVESAGGPATS